MTAGGIISLLVVISGGIFVFYKRKMLMEVFSLNMQSAVTAFQSQLETVATTIIRQMEERITHLEILLSEAEERSRQLEEKLQEAERILEDMDRKKSTLLAGKPVKQEVIKSEAETELPQQIILHSPFVATEKYKASNEQENSYENNDRRKLILTMAEQGYNVTEIARATGVGKGEIMLLLQLHRK